MDINIGIDTAHRQKISEGLGRLLADTYLLYIKTQNFHWNVTGKEFVQLHLLFERQYNELAMANDEIAERIRALGFPAPASYKQFMALTSIKEEDGHPTPDQMIAQLVQGHETLNKTIRAVFEIASNAHDEATVDLLNKRRDVHDKEAWMLRSLLE